MGTNYPSSSDPPEAQYKQFRAPKQNNTALIEPSHQELLALAKSRCEEVSESEATLSMAGVSQNELIQTARDSLLQMAQAWTQSYAKLPPSLATHAGPIIVSGHQPELFHPGVWFKNFALGNLAKSVGGIGIHLLIDSDLCRDVSIRVPTIRHNEPHVEAIAFDQTQPAMPFEERQVMDHERLRSFTDRFKQTFKAKHEPLLYKVWPNVCKAVEQGRTLGEALSQGRHQLELAHGNETLELPFSKVCDTKPFQCFVVEILSRAEEFQTAYNDSLARYRQAHKLRSMAQPLPDLATVLSDKQESWIETPFWIWSVKNPTRKALWCQRRDNQLLLTDQPDGSEPSRLELVLDIDQPELAMQQLQACRAEGIKIRSRALATTLYCRHLLADLFLHGIGGAKYDQVTDDLSKQFFGIAPPPHATLTATVRLFAEEPNEPQPSDVIAIQAKLRSYRYHPERWLDDGRALTEEQQKAVADKQQWIRTAKRVANASERHQAIEQANQLLYDSLLPERIEAEQELASRAKSLRVAPYFTSREYSFVLFPEAQLVNRLQSLARSTK